MDSGLSHILHHDSINTNTMSARVCKKCHTPILEVHAYELGDDRWHTQCFTCLECGTLLGCNSNFLVLGDGNLICSNCTYNCKHCGKKIDDLAILTGDQAYCSSCFKCRACKQKIEDLRYARTLKGLFCMACHEKLVAKKRKHDMKRRQMAQLEELLRPESPMNNSVLLFLSDLYLLLNISLVSVVNKLLPMQPDELVRSMPEKLPLPEKFPTVLSTDIEEVNDLDDELNLRRMREPVEPRVDRLARRESLDPRLDRRNNGDSLSVPNTPNTVYTVTELEQDEEKGKEKGKEREKDLDRTPLLDPLSSPHKNILLLLPIHYPDHDFHRPDDNPRLLILLPMAKVNRQARVVETNDEIAMLEIGADSGFDHNGTHANGSTKDASQSVSNGSHGSNGGTPAVTAGATRSGYGSHGAAAYPLPGLHGTRGTQTTLSEGARSEGASAKSVGAPGSLPGVSRISVFGSTSSTQASPFGSSQRSPETIMTTPKKSMGSSCVSSPPPRLTLPNVPSTPQRSVPSTPQREVHSASKQNMPSASQRDLSSTPRLNVPLSPQRDDPKGLGLEGVELLRPSRTSATPTVTNLEQTIEDERPLTRFHTVRNKIIHKRTTSGSLMRSGFGVFKRDDDRGHTRQPLDGSVLGLAYNTPPMPMSLLLSPGHTRSTSDSSFAAHDMELHRHELELHLLKAEVHQLETRRQSLLADNMKLTTDKSRIKEAIKALLKRLQADTAAHEELVRAISDLLSEKKSLAEENRLLRADLDEEDTETQRATRLRFWRRPKVAVPQLVTVASPPVAQSTLTANSEEQRKGLGLIINKSRSATNLDSIGPQDAPLFTLTLQRRAQYENERVPLIITKCIEEVERRGLDTEGIYRVSGGSSAVAAIEAAFANLSQDKRSMARLNDVLAGDINAVTGALKRYLRKLPDPLIPYSLYNNFIRVGLSTAAPPERCNELISKVLVRLPPANRYALYLLGKHLEVVNLYSTVNRMTYKNLLVVLAPTLARDATGEREILDMGPRNDATELLFSNFAAVLVGYNP